MGVPTSEVGYTSAMHRREDHEVRKGHVGGALDLKRKKERKKTVLVYSLVLWSIWALKRTFLNSFAGIIFSV